jgi:C4-type Zn-finger protein
MLQDFDFKFIHKARSKHGNVNALNHCLVNHVTEDENFVTKIQDIKMFGKMGIQTWIGRRCFKHNEMGTYRYKIPQIYMVEFEEQELDVGVPKDQVGVGILETIGDFQTHF